MTGPPDRAVILGPVIQASGPEALRRPRRPARRDAGGPAGTGAHRSRPQRLGQDDARPPAGHARATHGRPRANRGPRPRRRARRGAPAGRRGRPQHASLRRPHCPARTWPSPSAWPAAGPTGPGSTRRWRRSASTARPTPASARSRAGCGGAWRWRARCSASRGCCCSTRPSRGSTRTAPSAWRTISTPSRPAAAPPWWSPTAWGAPSRSPTAWRSSPRVGSRPRRACASLTEEALQRLYLGVTDASA